MADHRRWPNESYDCMIDTDQDLTVSNSPTLANVLTAEQIAYCLRQHEAGTPVAETVRKMAITEQTFYRWKNGHRREALVDAALSAGEVRRLKQFEKENRKLKQLVADLGLDMKLLQDVLSLIGVSLP